MAYVTYKGIRYYLERSTNPLCFFESTGKTFGDETQKYQIQNRFLPLLWKDGHWEIRQKDKKTVTIDGSYGWIVEATLDPHGEVIYSEVCPISLFVRKQVHIQLKRLH